MIFDSSQSLGWAHPLVRAATPYVGSRRRGYDPNQPRVPRGHSDGGQWTDNVRWVRAQFAAAERPPIGPPGRFAIALELARLLIDAFRRENGQLELFGHRTGAVTVTTIDGRNVYGSNPDLGEWRSIDRAEANRLRAIILQKHPELVDPDNIGRMPLNALYHAETNILLRAAKQHGGSLAGRTLEVFGDRPLCNNCPIVLPYVGLELGNPTVTFSDPSGLRRTMRDGRWIE
jgi:hypothetical protein